MEGGVGERDSSSSSYISHHHQKYTSRHPSLLLECLGTQTQKEYMAVPVRFAYDTCYGWVLKRSHTLWSRF